jgi:putative methionine-R-sulfoxide reductase with GAF domain
MPFEEEQGHLTRLPPGTGQVVLSPASAELAPSEQVQTLNRLSDPALSELGLEELLDELLVRVQSAVGVDTVAILLHDENSPQLVARAAKGIEEEVERGVRIPIGVGFAGRIAAERVPIFIADVDHADILNPILREKGIRSLLGVPLVVEGDLIGVLHVGSLEPREFGSRDLRCSSSRRLEPLRVSSERGWFRSSSASTRWRRFSSGACCPSSSSRESASRPLPASCPRRMKSAATGTTYSSPHGVASDWRSAMSWATG